ncbi:hypothetical protein P7K49_002168 [Saguinus oedipus]|uniref:Uncharacterized protein n=1 Tax=Saguinus oedipus TaxID=9490 RepID=A0ABQ9WGK8_SAGOE|nr:hypothetical protein P7K49_002168 [Saguinus oedipus]
MSLAEQEVWQQLPEGLRTGRGGPTSPGLQTLRFPDREASGRETNTSVPDPSHPTGPTPQSWAFCPLELRILLPPAWSSCGCTGYAHSDKRPPKQTQPCWQYPRPRQHGGEGLCPESLSPVATLKSRGQSGPQEAPQAVGSITTKLKPREEVGFAVTCPSMHWKRDRTAGHRQDLVSSNPSPKVKPPGCPKRDPEAWLLSFLGKGLGMQDGWTVRACRAGIHWKLKEQEEAPFLGPPMPWKSGRANAAESEPGVPLGGTGSREPRWGITQGLWAGQAGEERVSREEQTGEAAIWDRQPPGGKHKCLAGDGSLSEGDTGSQGPAWSWARCSSEILTVPSGGHVPSGTLTRASLGTRDRPLGPALASCGIWDWPHPVRLNCGGYCQLGVWAAEGSPAPTWSLGL